MLIKLAWLTCLALTIARAASLPACGTQFDYSCAAATLGGYTVVNPLPAAGETEITGYNSSNAIIFHQIIPAPPDGPAGADVQRAVLHAQNQIAVQSGLLTPPDCPVIGEYCPGHTGQPGAQTVVTSSSFQTFVPIDTPVTARIDQYSTTLIARLNGDPVFSATFLAPFSDPSVQAGILAAEAILASHSASYTAPLLLSSSTQMTGSQFSYVQTGEQPTGNNSITTTSTFGPVFLSGIDCLDLCTSPDVIFYVFPGQLDIDVHTVEEFGIDRNAITTNTFLTTQTYRIDGLASTSTPEPATWTAVLAGVLAMATRRKRKML